MMIQCLVFILSIFVMWACCLHVVVCGETVVVDVVFLVALWPFGISATLFVRYLDTR